jgi:Na+/H+-translocating membrane pyrophosphatase
MRGGAVSGFLVAALSLLGVYAVFVFFGGLERPAEAPFLIVGYGFGASFVALFAQLGGGIYTKAADVGADLVGKVENDFAEDSPKNPATIADNVGDNVGDIAGMGADLFGSFAEATCAALVIWTSSDHGKVLGASTFYPLMITAFGLISCFITSIFATHLMRVE